MRSQAAWPQASTSVGPAPVPCAACALQSPVGPRSSPCAPSLLPPSPPSPAASTAYTYLSNESPAGGDAAPSTPAARAALVCQNNLPATAL